MTTADARTIQEFVDQQYGGPVHLEGTSVVVMSTDVYREMTGVGTDAELDASLPAIRAAWAAAEQ